jgi:trimethylamine--corrinoid protein Co-methyltransferase
MERLHAGALRVLETTGLQIQSDYLLRVLADAGCRVNFAEHRAWFRPDLVERQIATQRDRYRLVRSSLWHPFCRALPEADAAVPPEFTVDYGFAAPWLYDHRQARYRQPTAEDQIAMIRLGNALECVKAVNAPLICADFPEATETIESARLLPLHTRKPGWAGTSSPREVKFLAEMAALAIGGNTEMLRSQPPIFVAAYCTTSPLKLDTRSAAVLEEALKYRFPVNFAPMPILGATAPMTPAGGAVVATAEILGCITATTLVDPELFHFSTSITGEMDMRTTQVCYASPAALLCDAALHQLFRHKYRLVHNVEPAYVEAKTPGWQAAFMKTYRQMALGATVSLPLAIGLLDNGAVFSPTQAMVDLDLNFALYKFAAGLEINDDTLALDLIEQMGFCARETHLQTEHTARHFRTVGWQPKLLDSTYCDHHAPATRSDDALLDKADAAWRELVARQPPVEREAAFVKEVERIAAAARKDLLA